MWRFDLHRVSAELWTSCFPRFTFFLVSDVWDNRWVSLQVLRRWCHYKHGRCQWNSRSFLICTTETAAAFGHFGAVFAFRCGWPRNGTVESGTPSSFPKKTSGFCSFCSDFIRRDGVNGAHHFQAGSGALITRRRPLDIGVFRFHFGSSFALRTIPPRENAEKNNKKTGSCQVGKQCQKCRETPLRTKQQQTQTELVEGKSDEKKRNIHRKFRYFRRVKLGRKKRTPVKCNRAHPYDKKKDKRPEPTVFLWRNKTQNPDQSTETNYGTVKSLKAIRKKNSVTQKNSLRSSIEGVS